MRVLTAAEMRDVDRRTIEELGIPEQQLMVNAGMRVVEFLVEKFSPLKQHRIAVLCGNGNNGGDGRVVARQLLSRFRPMAVWEIGLEDEIAPEMRSATIVVDAVLGFGVHGPARGRQLDLIRETTTGFPAAKVVAVDLPSGMNSDSGKSEGEVARADYCVTFTAPKVAHALAPNCDRMGEVRVAQIGSPASLYEHVKLNLSEPSEFAHLFAPREKDSNKGRYGHVLVAGGARGKTGAAEMTALAALRIGAGLVTVGSSAAALGTLELMTDFLPPSDEALRSASVLAIGPGLGMETDLVLRLLRDFEGPVVVDADGLNSIADQEWTAGERLRVLTPHPGEMSRLVGKPVQDVQADRVGVARAFGAERGCVVVLKGHRTAIAFPDGRAWINPTSSPAMATAGTGDILTGLIAGMMAQFPYDAERAVIAAVYLHGLAGDLGAAALGEQCLIATDLLRYLPEAIRAVRNAI